MSDQQDHEDERPDEHIDDQLIALLADPATWEEPPSDIEDFLVAQITDQADAVVVPLFSRRRIAQTLLPFAAGVAATLLLMVAIQSRPDPVAGTEVALAGTPLAPDARATMLVTEGSLGVRIILDTTGLTPPPDGFYYEAWVRKDAEVGVSAGTFHMRGGDGAIELWAGVSPQDYPLLTVTLQEEGQGPASSGHVVLKGHFDSK